MDDAPAPACYYDMMIIYYVTLERDAMARMETSCNG